MNLTMEAVADRARTGKQVLYRRWHNRAELVLAAVRSRVVSISDDVPDTGELRGDVLAVVGRMARRYHDIGPDVLHGLMAEVRDIGPEFFSAMADVMETILQRAADRGEIPSGAADAWITTLPVDLLRHEMLLTSGPVPESTLVEIVDDVFLPLVTCRAGRRS